MYMHKYTDLVIYLFIQFRENQSVANQIGSSPKGLRRKSKKWKHNDDDDTLWKTNIAMENHHF